MFEKFVSKPLSEAIGNGSDASILCQGLVKTIPGTPEGKTPIHEVRNPVFTTVQK